MSDPVLGYAIFCAVKFAGYTAAAWALKRAYRVERPSILLIGLARTLLGMAAGAALWGLTIAFEAPIVGLAGLPLVRVGEWWLLVWGFFDRPLATPGRDWGWVALGVLWSFALDLPATLGFLSVAGFRVC